MTTTDSGYKRRMISITKGKFNGMTFAFYAVH
jgi:hypothetical protein